MPLVKVGPKHQVVIPKAVREKLKVDPGDYVEVVFENNHAVIKRKKVIDDFPVTDEPIGPKARARIRQGMKDVKEGRVSGPYPNVAAFLADLHSHLRRPKS